MDLRIAYVSFGAVVVALGVINCIINSAAAKLAGKSETGGFYGLSEAVEKLTGIVGPAIGGLLSRSEEPLGLPNMTAYIAVVIYMFVALVSALFYHRLVEMDDSLEA